MFLRGLLNSLKWVLFVLVPTVVLQKIFQQSDSFLLHLCAIAVTLVGVVAGAIGPMWVVVTGFGFTSERDTGTRIAGLKVTQMEHVEGESAGYGAGGCLGFLVYGAGVVGMFISLW